MKGIAVIAVCAAIVGLVVAVVLATWIKKQSEGTDRMKEISSFIREGAFEYLLCLSELDFRVLQLRFCTFVARFCPYLQDSSE